MLLGAGRRTKEDSIDFGAGISLKRKLGDRVEAGDVQCVLHTNLSETSEAEKKAFAAYRIDEGRPEKAPYIYTVIG
jgi:thymidine phosphorylase